jgi:replicative DNA helicase
LYSNFSDIPKTIKRDDSNNVSNLLAEIQDKTFKIVNGVVSATEEMGLLGDGIEEFLECTSSKPIGLDLGYAQWQEDVGEVSNGTVHGIFGRMKAGKSQFVMQCLANTAIKYNKPALLLDSEMGKPRQHARFLGHVSNIPYQYMRNGKWRSSEDYIQRVNGAVKAIKNAPLVYEHIPGQKIDDIINHIRKFVLRYVGISNDIEPRCLIVYDYLKVRTPEQAMGMEKHDALGYMTSSLHDIAQKLNVPIILIGQRNRLGEKEDTSDTISGSDQIAQDLESFSFFRKKTDAEIQADPLENGGRIIRIVGCRDGIGHDDDDNYINLKFDKSTGHLIEGPRRSDVFDRLKQFGVGDAHDS